VEGLRPYGTRGSSLTRLNQSAHPFIALQSAIVVGPGADFSTSFLAINRAHVLSAQEMFSVNLVAEEVAAGTATKNPDDRRCQRWRKPVIANGNSSCTEETSELQYTVSPVPPPELS